MDDSAFNLNPLLVVCGLATRPYSEVDLDGDGLIEFKELNAVVKECRTVGAAARTGTKVLTEARRRCKLTPRRLDPVC